LTGWVVAVVRRPSAIAGRGWFAEGALPRGTALFAGRPEAAPMNHSCDPNTWWSGDLIVARRDIAAGEELTIDYSTGTADPSFLLACHCESYRCRQMVTGDDWRIPELQRRYAGHWAPAVQRLIGPASDGPG
jgi:hypothetical protein